MSSKEFFFSQCSNCGKIHEVDVRYRPRGDGITYMTLWCDRCETMTRQLDCGEDSDDLYHMSDINLDKRYYNY